MDKETFILQTTRTGRLPTNAVFSEEAVARAQTERAEKSGAFEHIKLVSMVGTARKLLVEIGKPAGHGPSAAGGKGGRPRARKKQITGSQLIGRISTLITLVLIAAVVAYAYQVFMRK